MWRNSSNFCPTPQAISILLQFRAVRTPVGIRACCTLLGNYELDPLLGMNLNKMNLLIKDII
ncbi:hypothetical protein T4D_3714 [Trichinella pseudospiralis]|uniref:Uncharacterized protein n=1 Tax=Trichinella pseudospiralis TaxID=6337 RepID=A0A0V1FSQ1_TRIPS|nr:hypothetical protein T4D_3714 [Trichinella pseudospiralis]